MTTRRSTLGALLVAALAGAAAPPTLAADAQALLAASDAVRNPGQPFRMTVTVVDFEKGQQVNTTTMTSYARTLEASGQFATLLRFVEPARDAGKLMMKNGADLWYFDPSTKASVRISPQQRLMGEASNGDVLTVNFARDYKATLEGDEEIGDGEKKKRNAKKLLLKSASDDATYAAIELWIDAETSAPIKARFLADSGRLLKTAYYRRWQQHMGALRPTETVIIDGLQPQSVTIVRYSDFAPRNIPAAWFQRDFLPRFQGE